MRSIIAAIALAAMLLAGGTALAQVPREYAAQLAQGLARAEIELGHQGFTRAAGPFAGALAVRGVSQAPVTLRSGQEYRIIGVCDADCDDLDLRLLDGAGAVIAQDVAPNDLPQLIVRPRMTGPYVIETQMARCANAPCYFAVNVYVR